MADKTYPYAVIIGGKLYPANTPIPVKESTPEQPAKKAVNKNDKGSGRKA